VDLADTVLFIRFISENDTGGGAAAGLPVPEPARF
jgi:hypothetical protein